MGAIIKNVDKNSIADKLFLKEGDVLLKINDNLITDVLDYKFYSYDTNFTLNYSRDGQENVVKVIKREGEDLGLEFESYLMDKKKSCSNKCIFCFIDQNPKNMRSTIYFKDDDARLSFLLGNYISLTNLSEKDVDRIINMRLAPVNVSVHTTNPELRDMMLGNSRGSRGLSILEKLCKEKLRINAQIVVCEGINDGDELKRSLNDLKNLGSIFSISVVPAGITKHREGLFDLKPITKENAINIVKIVEDFGKECFEELGTSLAFCGDEFYIKAGLELPEKGYYEDFTQLENGVGMISLFKSQFELCLREEMFKGEKSSSFTIATASAAYPFLSELLEKLKENDNTIDGNIIKIENEFYGQTVSVAGLVTGSDLIRGLSGQKLGSKVLITENMLRDGGDVFLDDLTLLDVSQKLGVPIKTVENDGYCLLEEIYTL